VIDSEDLLTKLTILVSIYYVYYIGLSIKLGVTYRLAIIPPFLQFIAIWRKQKIISNLSQKVYGNTENKWPFIWNQS